MEQLLTEYPEIPAGMKKLTEQLEQKIRSMCEEQNNQEKKSMVRILTDFREMLDICAQYEELLQKYEEFETTALALASGDFSGKVDLLGTHTIYARLGLLLNRMAGRMQESMVRRHFLDAVLECISDSAVILTDTDGRILYLNQQTSVYLNRPPEDIVNLNIATAFVSQKQFAGDSAPSGDMLTLGEWLRPYNAEPVYVKVFIRALTGVEGKPAGYLYILKQIGEDMEN